MKTTREKLLEIITAVGSRKIAAERLSITPRYLDMLLANKKPGKHLEKYINMYRNLNLPQ